MARRSGCSASGTGSVQGVPTRFLSASLSAILIGATLVGGIAIPGEFTPPEANGPLSGDVSHVAQDSGQATPDEGRAVLELHSTADNTEFSYRFVVNGTVEKTQLGPGGIAADTDDTVTDHGNGTVTVTGSTGDGAGDAYLIDGSIVSSSIEGSDEVRVLLTRDITEQFLRDDQTPEQTFEVHSTGDEQEFTYRILVNGTVEGTQLGEGGLAADSDDEITAFENGTMAVTGSTGDGAGDAFTIRGEIIHFRKVEGSDDYRLRLDGQPYPQEHTLEIVPTNEDARYRVEVAGSITPAAIDGRSTNPADTIDRNVVTGDVVAGFAGDSYRYSGDRNITILAGDARILVDGDPISPKQPSLVNLNVSTTGLNVTVTNPHNQSVTVRSQSRDDETQRFVVPASGTVTEQFVPGNYTLTAGTANAEQVLLNGERRLPVTLEPGDAPNQITSCQNITEAGVYEVQADLAVESPAPCLHIKTSDVTLAGNGHTLTGDGIAGNESYTPADSGIWVHNDTESSAMTNVTIRNINIEGWENGIQGSRYGGPGAQIRIENTAVRNNEYGLSFDESVEATVTNVQIEENTYGVVSQESRTIRLDSVTVRNNSGYGIIAGQAAAMSIANSVVSGNEDAGVLLSNEGAETRLRNVTIAENGGPGLSHSNDVSGTIVAESRIENNSEAGIDVPMDAGGLTVRNGVVRNNGEQGLHVHGETEPDVERVRLENVTISQNNGLEIEAEAGAISATAMQVGPAATFSFERESVTLESLPRDGLPTLPDNATAVSPGMNITGVDESLQMQLTRTSFETDDTIVRMWRYVAGNWSTVATPDGEQAPETIGHELSSDGIYALLTSTSTSPAPRLSREDVRNRIRQLNPTDVDEYELPGGGHEIRIEGTEGDATIQIQEDGDATYVEGKQTWPIETGDIEIVAATETPSQEETATQTPSVEELAESSEAIRSIEQNDDGAYSVTFDLEQGTTGAQATATDQEIVETTASEVSYREIAVCAGRKLVFEGYTATLEGAALALLDCVLDLLLRQELGAVAEETATATPTSIETPSPTPVPSPTPTPTETPTPTPAETPTPTKTPTKTPTPTPTESPTLSPTPDEETPPSDPESPTSTPEPTTPSPTPEPDTATPTAEDTPTPAPPLDTPTSTPETAANETALTSE